MFAAHSPYLSKVSAGIRWRFLKGAVGGCIEDRSVGGQHVASWVLGGSLRLWLGENLRGQLALVLLRRAGGGGGDRASPRREHLGSSRCLVVGVMLWERRRNRKWLDAKACGSSAKEISNISRDQPRAIDQTDRNT